MTVTKLKVVLAGGGTGGHIIPAIAIADEIVSRGGQVRFVGTADRIEARLVPAAGYGIDFIKVKPLTGGGFVRKVTGLGSAPVSVIRSARLLRKIKPQVVIGVGGYVAGPVVLAAWFLGIPTALLEQNATVGLTNRLLSRFVRRAFVSYEQTSQAFSEGRARFTGNPVRQAILEASRLPEPPAGPMVKILVMGGSQGAASIDRMVPAAMKIAELANKVEVLHQSKQESLEGVLAAYRDAGIEARTTAFIDDTATAFLNADLVVARSGATTVSELTVMGLPAIFLPYPHHADRQQEKNATPMKQAGAAMVLDEKKDSVEDLARAIGQMVTDENMRNNARKASRDLGRPEAASAIADQLVELAEGS